MRKGELSNDIPIARDHPKHHGIMGMFGFHQTQYESVHM